jgi:hypothetical protein
VKGEISGGYQLQEALMAQAVKDSHIQRRRNLSGGNGRGVFVSFVHQWEFPRGFMGYGAGIHRFFKSGRT